LKCITFSKGLLAVLNIMTVSHILLTRAAVPHQPRGFPFLKINVDRKLI